MKPFIFSLIAIAFSLFSIEASSQDIILFKDGSEIKSKVIEITETLIKYKRFTHQDGPLISIPKSKVFMITYENGTKELISVEKSKPDVEYNKVDYVDESDKITVTYSKVEYHRKEIDREVYNLIKVNPLLIFNGDIPIYYEHRLSDNVSVEAGIGITHLDYIYEGFRFDENLENFDAGRIAKLGYSLRAGLKFYPSNYTHALDEFYIGPEIRFKHYNTEISIQGSTNKIYPEYRTIVDFKISGGYIYYITDRVMFDFYGGIGLRSKRESRAQIDTSGPITITIPPSLQRSTLPALALGIKVGFGF